MGRACDTVRRVTVSRDFDVVGPERGDTDRVAAFAVTVPADLMYLEGHFPGRPIVPGVAQLLLVERAARAAWPALGAPSSIRRLKFLDPLAPRDRLALRLEREDDAVRFVLTRDTTECSRGTLVF